ncbi:glycosyl transferase [Aureimonas endophytica]|uniref:Glycosyl transferase n=1 Tax=Aureimonas endophytica TaxID=2027858 RepID=A0A916ZGB1_9HYPH|nr:glycosyltransferase family 4 protein [Aureimonas endophytica]GGD95845.1 glycosyl transferase [Aureimonas endophytica]
MAKMKIVHLLNHTHQANGHVELAVDLACEQAAQGHEVTMLSGPGDFGDCLRDNGVAFVQLPQRDGHVGQIHAARDMALALRRLRPDVVNAHMVKAALIARAARLATPFALVTTVHNSFDRPSPLMRVGDLVIAVSAAVKREMAEKGIKAEKLRVVHNGLIGGKRRPPLPERRLPLHRPAVATVAGLHGRKGVDTLVEAFLLAAPRIPEAHLYIVGEGTERPRLEAMAAPLGERAHFLGYLRDPREVLASVDVFVLASRAEPFGLVLVEALQMGCACIGSDVGGIPEVLGFGAKGRLVPPSRPDLLAEVLIELVRDEAQRHRLTAAAQAELGHFSVERMARETEAVYDEARRLVRRHA